MKTIRIVVSGRVQGVGYRFFVVDSARRLGIAGYTRNLPSRQHVEVVASGTQDVLDKLTDLLWVGPTGAHVDHLEVAELPGTQLFDGFEIAF